MLCAGVVSLSSLISVFSLDLSSITDALLLSLGALVLLGLKVIYIELSFGYVQVVDNTMHVFGLIGAMLFIGGGRPVVGGGLLVMLAYMGGI